MIALLTVTSNCLEYLAGQSLLERAIEKLKSVRGVSRLLLLPVDLTAEQLDTVKEFAAAEHDGCKVYVAAVPHGATLFDTVRHVAATEHCSSAAHLVAYNPAFPFLTGGRIERILHNTVAGEAAVAFSGRNAFAMQGLPGKRKLQSSRLILNACVAVKLPVTETPEGQIGILTLSETEAIDVETPRGLEVAEAVMAAGCD